LNRTHQDPMARKETTRHPRESKEDQFVESQLVKHVAGERSAVIMLSRPAGFVVPMKPSVYMSLAGMMVANSMIPTLRYDSLSKSY
jgi:hypothetical protein